ncbi:MAG: hypothetical protein P8170_08100 [Gemmatimonadota bacterium]
MLTFLLTILWVGTAGTALALGLDYYLLPADARAFSELAPLFAPTGLVGHGLGIVGSAMIALGVIGYTLRKRVALLSRLGSLRTWLKVHIFLCTLGPFLVLLHTTFKFGGIVSIAFWSMAVVVASGVLGRYVYVRIPKTVNGRFLGLEAVRERATQLTRHIAQRSGLAESEVDAVLAPWEGAPSGRGLVSAVAFALAEDVRGARHVRHVGSYLRSRGVPRDVRRQVLKLAREQRSLRQQALFLLPFQRLFRYWHVLHLPLATVMFLVLAVHVTVSVLFGYTWIF